MNVLLNKVCLEIDHCHGKGKLSEFNSELYCLCQTPCQPNNQPKQINKMECISTYFWLWTNIFTLLLSLKLIKKGIYFICIMSIVMFVYHAHISLYILKQNVMLKNREVPSSSADPANKAKLILLLGGFNNTGELESQLNRISMPQSAQSLFML